jgi:hypothetical protein
MDDSIARSVAWCSASMWSAPGGSGLLTLKASSMWTDPDRSRRIVWMIKAHSILDRMAAGGRTPRQYRPARATPMACDGCTESQLRRPCDRPPLARPMYAGHKAADLTQQVSARRVATTSRLRRPLASRPGDDKGPLGRRSLPSHRRVVVEALLASATSSARRAPCRPSARRGALRTSSATNSGRCGT